MAVYKAIPSAFARIHRKYLTPTVSTVAMGGISIVIYVAMNYLTSGGAVIVDSVSALGVMIAFYYGLTGFSCTWYYRKTLRERARSLWLRGILPFVGGVILWFCMGWSFWYYWNNVNSDTRWTLPGTHRIIGGVFILDVGVLVIGIVLMYAYAALRPAYFRGEVLNRDTPTRVPEDIGVPVGLFGIDPFDTDADGAAGKGGNE
jgi:amino acid transporter